MLQSCFILRAGMDSGSDSLLLNRILAWVGLLLAPECSFWGNEVVSMRFKPVIFMA